MIQMLIEYDWEEITWRSFTFDFVELPTTLEYLSGPIIETTMHESLTNILVF